MAAPQRQARPVSRPVRRPIPESPAGRPDRRSGRVQRRRFVVLVVAPVLLMLGSVYLHTVAANLGDRALVLEGRHAELLVEKERLEVEVSQLSAPDRVRSLAREQLGMKLPGAEDVRVYDGEDGRQDGGQEIQEGAR